MQIGSGTLGSIAGNIFNNATLVFNRADNPIFGGAISGSGGLVQAGSGILTLTGGNTYSGATAVSAGTLQVGGGGSGEFLASPSITLSNNAAVVFSHSDSLTYGGAITGAGSLAKLGVGTLTLAGTDTYLGGTTVSAGTLQVGNGGSLNVAAGSTLAVSSAVVVAAGGQLNLNGGSLSVSYGIVSVTAGGQLTGGSVALGTGVLTAAGPGAMVNLGTLSCNGYYPSAAVFSSASSGTLGSLQIACPYYLPSNYVSIQSGAQIALAGPLSVGAGPYLSGSMTITGTGSQLVQTANQPVTIGAAAGGLALVTVASGATLVTTGPTCLNSMGTLVANSGGAFTANGGVTVNGGNLLVNGAFGLGTGHALTVQTGGLADFALGPFFLDRGTSAPHR